MRFCSLKLTLLVACLCSVGKALVLQSTGSETALESEFGESWWALAVDGKDAEAGRSAFGDFEPILKVYPVALGDDAGRADITMKFLSEYGRTDFRICDGRESPMRNFGEQCFRALNCSERIAAVATVPAQVLDVSRGGECSVEYALPRDNCNVIVSELLEQLVANYTRTMQNIPPEQKDRRLMVLAQFLKSFAWVHPYPDGNGRTRTLILQHELRRLGLGRGAFMYNNNRDIYFIDDMTYVSKIKEGIRMAELGRKTKVNPWLDAANVEAHLRKFPPLFKKGACHEGGGWGSTMKKVK
jgi:hypothetical protein